MTAPKANPTGQTTATCRVLWGAFAALALSVIMSIDWAIHPTRLTSPSDPHWYIGNAVNLGAAVWLFLAPWLGRQPFPITCFVLGLLVAKLAADTFPIHLILIALPPFPLFWEIPLLLTAGAMTCTLGVLYEIELQSTPPAIESPTIEIEHSQRNT